MQINNKNRKWKKTLVCLLSAITCFSAFAAVGALSTKAENAAQAPENTQTQTAASPSSLWNQANGVTVSDNGDIPTWAKNGWRVHKADWISVSDEYITEEDLPESRKKGVKVVSTSETSRLEYKNVINIDGFTKDDTIVEFVPITSFRVSSADFTGMKIWITDADDESNWICVNMYAVDAQFGGATRIEAETSTGIDAAYRWGTYHDRATVATFYEGGRRDFYNAAYSSYYDKLNDGGRNSLYDMIYEPFSVHYDVEDKSVWVSDYTYGGKKCLLDLDDTEYAHVNENNAFGGFTSNRVKIALQTYNIVDTAQYVVLNVANNPMNGTAVVDTTMPEYLETLPDGGIPTASVGKAYKTFDLEFYDFYDGTVAPEIYVKEESESSFGEPIQGNAFVPETQGRYTLRYVATDKAGNSRIVDYPIFAQYALPPIELAFQSELNAEYLVGEKIVFPVTTASGGSGPLTVETKVVRLSDGAEITHNGKEFIPYVASEYAVTYIAKDYVGNVYTESMTCTVLSQQKPVYTNELTMYKKFVSGIPVQLPEAEIYDYDSVPGQRIKAITEVVVSSAEDASVKEVVENYVFTPTIEKFGSKVNVTYISRCEEYPNKIEKSFSVDLIEAKNSWDYLWNNTDSQVTGNTQYERGKFASVTATKAGNVSVGFINPLQAENFAFQFDSEKDKDLFDSIRLELVDFIDSSVRLEVTIQKDQADPSKTYVIYNGTKMQMTGAFGQDAQLVLTYADGKLTDYANEVVANFDGFAGFPSGRVWASVSMVNAKVGACLKIMRLGNHSLFANYSANQDPPLKEFKDTVTPTIVLSKPVPSDVKINTQVVLPTAVAYDACTPYMQTTLTLIDPTGKVLLQNVDASKEFEFVADVYGDYTVTYTAKDANNRKNATYTLSVFDLTKPVIVYHGADKLYCRAGESLTFDSIEVYDAVDENLTVCLFVIAPNSIMKTLGEDRTFTFTKSGRYTLRYYVYDSNYNFEMLDVEIIVGE